MYKVESLAKTGATDEAASLLKNISIAINNNADTYYLKGLI